jgi:XTP/dITP diphosphohydrolase
MVATGNRHKVAEFATLLAGFALQPAPSGFTAVEDGATFAANAAIKVLALKALLAGQKRQTSPLPPLWLLADDSGLVVPALGGAPGVHSARYAAPAADQDAANRAKLLAALSGATLPERAAHFICVLALLPPDGPMQTVEGRIDGHISTVPRGEHGFGYDALFVPEGFEQTFAEGGPALKERLSHRARAVAALLAL